MEICSDLVVVPSGWVPKVFRNNNMDQKLQIRFALEGAAESLQTTIQTNEKRLGDLRKQIEDIQQCIFVGFDANDKLFGSVLVSDNSNKGIFVSLDTQSARKFLARKQARLENDVIELSQKIKDLFNERNGILDELKNLLR